MRLFLALTLTLPVALAAPFSGSSRISPTSHPSFERNLGQVGESVEWVVRQGADTPMFLRATGAAIARYTPNAVKFVEMRFDGARADAESEGEQPLESYSNYYLGRDARSWFTGIPHFARVRYREIYPGIDLVYRANGNEIEYDFDVKPGADPSVIHISFHGIDQLRTNHGDLILTSGGREFRQRQPRIWQDGMEIAGNYRVEDGRVGIELAAYDRSRAVLIDPVLQFASYLGGPGNENPGAVQVDGQGYLYLAGSTQSIVSPGLNPFTQSGQIVVSPIVFKFSPDGSRLIYYLTIAVDNKTTINGLAIDGSGNLMVAGETTALQLPLKNAIDSQFKALIETVFAAKWTSDGRTLVYSTYFGGSGNEHAKAGAVVDAAGNLYFAGTTSSLDLPVVNALQPVHGGGSSPTPTGTQMIALAYGSFWAVGGPLDCYVTKLSPQGKLLFSTYLGGPGDEHCMGLALAPDGAVVLAGDSDKAGFPLVNAILRTPTSIDFPIHSTPIVAKLQADGQALVFSTFFGANGNGPATYGTAVEGSARSVAVDASGNIYIAGECSPGLPTKNAFQSQAPRSTSGYVAALDSSGQSIIYTTYLDGASTNLASTLLYSLAVDSQGSLYIAGTTSVPDFPSKGSLRAFQGVGATNSDFLLARLSSSGSSLLFSTFLGSNTSGTPAISLGPDGSIFYAGAMLSANLLTLNPFQAAYAGSSDIVFMKLTDTAVQTGPPASITAAGGTPQNAGVNTDFPAALQARVTDATGNPLPGVTVNFQGPASGAGATLSAASTVTNSFGLAAVIATANATTGAYTVTATTAGVARSASFALTNVGGTVTVQTSPTGIPFTVDGTTYTVAHSFTFQAGSLHTISVSSTIPSGAFGQLTFTGWSDGQSASHTITAPATSVTYTASFVQQYQLITNVSPAGSGTVTPPTGYFDANSTVSLVATPASGNTFQSWTGPVTVTGARTGTVVITGPLAVTANFSASTATVTPNPVTLQYYLGTAPASGAQQVSVSSSTAISFTVSFSNPSQNMVTVSPTSGVTPATVTVTPINSSGLAAGNFTIPMVFTFADGTKITDNVQLQLVAQPSMAVAPASLSFAAQAGSTSASAQTLAATATNRDIGIAFAVTYGSAQDPAWLKLSPSNGNTPLSLTVTSDPTGLSAGTHQATIVATSTSAANSPLAIPVTFVITATSPGSVISTLLNSASYGSGPAATNEILSAFGSFPGCASSNAQVLVDGASTDVFYSSEQQVNFLMPPTSASQTTSTVKISCNGTPAVPFTITVSTSSPGLFVSTQDGKGQVAVVNQDGTVNTPSPAGTYIQLYATGLGPFAAASADGLQHMALAVTATVGSAAVPLTLLYAGEAPHYTKGLQQINLLIPADAPTGVQPLTIKVGTPPNQVQVQSGVTITISPAATAAN